jgi:N-acetylmuramoyl-L-alanine amidase
MTSLKLPKFSNLSVLLNAICLFTAMIPGVNSFAQKDSTLQKKEVVLSARTQGKLPFLKYGPGLDRLGGAKMTYLDTAIFLQVIDSLKDDYLVRLSKNHQSLIQKENVRLIPFVKKPDYSLTSSWKVWGDAKQDYLTIGLDERLAYKSTQLINPSRIEIDIYGATSNTNWITQLKSAKEIKNVYYEQSEDDVFRVSIELKHSQPWGYSIRYKNKTLVIAVKRPPDRHSIRHLKIAIDAGHGGVNIGATSAKSGVEEKKCNLQIAKLLEKRLKRMGAEVYMTRTADTDISMLDRSLMLREANPDLLLSIHHNSADNATVKGVSTYYRYIGFKPLSVAILNRMLSIGLSEFGNIGSFNFSLNGPTEFPNCLVEVGFLSNEEDEKRITDPKFQSNVAKMISKGVKDWIRTAK